VNAVDDLLQARTVKHWFASARLDGATDERAAAYLSLLAAFSDRVGKSPDELVEYCFLRKKDTGERFCSVQRRGNVNTWIEEFVAAEGWTGKEAVVNGNALRSFMIHNGAMIQGKAWRG